MNFDSVNYSFLLQDFIFAMAAGFAVAGVNSFLSLFICGGKAAVFVRDMLTCFLFAVAVFSFVVSFANYPDIRFYHIISAFFGYLCYNFNFAGYFEKFSKKIFSKAKNKMLCRIKKYYRTICVFAAKKRKKAEKQEKSDKKEPLKNGEIWVYNL